MSDFTFTMQRIYNTPLAITPERATFVLAALRDRFGIGAVRNDLQRLAGRDLDDVGARARASVAGARRERGSLYPVSKGIAIIEVEGVLVKKNGLDPDCGMTGYDGIERKVRAALADDEVRAIWFDVNSGGGEVSGCFGLCDFIYENRASNGGKLMVAMAADDAYSAAYAIASSADVVAVTPSGGVGSIGVLVVHAEESKALEEEGVTATIIRSGIHKARFNSIEPLADDVRARVQREIDEVRDQFVDLVARNRGLDTKTVFQTEGLTYMGRHAGSLGLVNDVISEQEMFARLVRTID